MPVLDVYSRPGCHLCEVLLEQLLELVRGRAELCVHDIESREDWRERYGLIIPVVEVEGTELCRFKLDRNAVLAALAVQS